MSHTHTPLSNLSQFISGFPKDVPARPTLPKEEEIGTFFVYKNEEYQGRRDTITLAREMALKLGANRCGVEIFDKDGNSVAL